MTRQSTVDLALAAADLWGGCDAPPVLVAERENAVFRARLRQGETVAIRLHRPGYLDMAAIETELAWTDALAAAGIACPEPLRSVHGRLVETVMGGRAASVVRWIDATPIADAPAPSERLYHRLGQCLGSLHAAADRIGLCPVPRRTWKATDLTGAAPRWGLFDDNPALTRPEAAFLQDVRETAQRDLSRIPHPDVGLIHADPLAENVLDDGARLWLIDFDDSGWGYRGYDLATALVQSVASPRLPVLQAALGAGYLEARPESGDTLAHIGVFTALRGMATAGWVVPRVPSGDPRLRHYAERALSAARLYLAS